MAKMSSKNWKFFEYWGMSLTLTPDFISGETNEKFMFIFNRQEVFHYPMKQISVVRYIEWPSPTKKDLITIGVLLVIGVATVVFFVGIVFLLLAWFLVWKKIKKTVAIEIFSGTQSQILSVPTTAPEKVKQELKAFSNEVLEELTK